MLELIQRANNQLDKTAIIDSNGTYDYRELLDASASVANELLAGQDDLNEKRVAFLVPPGFDYVRIQWGIWRAGGIAVPLCTLHPLPSLTYVIENTRADILILSPEFEYKLSPYAREHEIRLIRTATISQTPKIDLPEIDPSRRAMILYTSGTTNLPKGVVTTHANIEAQITTLIKAWEWSAEDHILCILPLHHVHGIINVVSCALWAGAKVEFLPKFDAKAVCDLFLQGEINLFMAVPTIYFKLISYWEGLEKEEQKAISEKLNAFRLMVSGSAALPISVLEKWRVISGQTLLERYGMTEIGMAVSNSYRGERRPGHIGLPLPGVELRLVDELDQLIEEGEQG
ncbi:MAG: AMP-binding protein, partial [Bacteroidota bacterium]